MIRTTLAALLLTTPAYAGGYVASITDAPPVPRPAQASAHNWTGAYVGLSYGTQRSKSQRATYEDRELTETHREERPFTKRDLQGFLRDNGGCTPGQKFHVVSGDNRAQISCQSVLNAEPHESWDNWAVEGFDPVVTEWEEVVGSETVQTGTEMVRTTDSTAGVFAGYRHQFGNRFVGGVEASYSRVGGEDSTRLMAQGGYSLGRVLPYLTAGYDFAAEAPVFGAGIDVALTKRLLGGLAYTRADDAERIEARMGWRF